LRIHVEDAAWAAATGLDLPAWRPLQEAYHGLTGWQLDCTAQPLAARAEPLGTIPDLFGTQPGQMYRLPPSDPTSRATSEDHARQLAEALADVYAEVQTTRQTLRHREAELAAAIPVTARPQATADFSHRLQAVLRGTVESLHGRAAALYLLDDATTELKLRSHWGLSSLRFLEPARPLRSAVVDLEALTGHAVVLENTELFPHWNVPEAFASAVCLPVASPETLLGTLWFFADEVRDYSSNETQLLEIIAGRVAVELERCVLLQEVLRAAEHREHAEYVGAWHRERALQSAPLLDGWQVAGEMVGQRQRGDFHTWRMGERGELWLASAAVSGAAAESMLSSTLLQGAVRAALTQPTDPLRMMQRLNEVLWSSASGGEGASMLCGALDAITGRFDYVTAGSTDAYILRPHGWEPIVVDGVPLGRDDQWTALHHSQEIHPGDVLLVISDRQLARSDEATAWNTTALAETLLRHIHLSAKDLAGMAAQLVAKQLNDTWARSVLVVKRRDDTSPCMIGPAATGK
jgi:hypothetical protein